MSEDDPDSQLVRVELGALALTSLADNRILSEMVGTSLVLARQEPQEKLTSEAAQPVPKPGREAYYEMLRARPASTWAEMPAMVSIPTIGQASSTIPADLDSLVRDAETLYFCSKGDGMTEVTIRAFRLFFRAAEGGHSEAQNYLGLCYCDGDGVQQNPAEAVRWWRMAAEQGNAMAQSNLAICYCDGVGVQEDYVEAVKLFLKAADQGQAKAQNYLGVCYANGKGVQQDDVEAVKWYRKAAKQRNAWAQFSLGRGYRGGQGVELDLPEAYKWLRLAADQGHEQAEEEATALVALMSPSELRAAQRLYREFKDKYSE